MRRFSIKTPHHVKRLVRVTGMMCMAHLGFSAPPPYDAENTINTHIENYMTTYNTLSTWICHGAVFAPGRRDYREALKEVLVTLEDRFKALILEKLNAGEFTDVMRIPYYVTVHLTKEKSKDPHENTTGYLTYHTEILKSLVPTLHTYVNEHVQHSFDRYMQNAAFAKALQLANVYATHINQKLADSWISRIKDQATSALEELVKKSIALKEQPLLAKDECARAESLIHSFPKDHVIRVHLESRLNELYKDVKLSSSDDVNALDEHAD